MSDKGDPTRFFPVRPDLNQLKHQAKDLLRGLRRGEADAIAEFNQSYPNKSNRQMKYDLLTLSLLWREAMARRTGHGWSSHANS